MSDKINDAAKTVHKEMGAGYTESVYHSALQVELSRRGIEHSSEGTIPIIYRGKPVGRRRPDLFVETEAGVVVIELKAGTNSGDQQLLQYLDLLDQDNNFSIVEGRLIQFNSDCEISTKELDSDQ